MIQFNIVSKMHPERVNWIIANSEVASCIPPVAHGAKP